MKINNKGFTLIELLAAVVILSIIVAIMVPSVNYLINKNKEDNYNALKASIISAAKVYISDNRYNITLKYDDNGGLCGIDEDEEDIAKIVINGAESILNNSKLPIKLLVESKTLSTISEDKIINPRDKNQSLNLDSSYVLVKYQCNTKDYTYKIEEIDKGDLDNSLKWNQ